SALGAVAGQVFVHPPDQAGPSGTPVTTIADAVRLLPPPPVEPPPAARPAPDSVGAALPDDATPAALAADRAAHPAGPAGRGTVVPHDPATLDRTGEALRQAAQATPEAPPADHQPGP